MVKKMLFLLFLLFIIMLYYIIKFNIILISDLDINEPNFNKNDHYLRIEPLEINKKYFHNGYHEYSNEHKYKYTLINKNNYTSKITNNNKNIISSLIIGYKDDILCNFLTSLRKVNDESYLLAFTDYNTSKIIEKYYPRNRLYNIILKKEYPYYPSDHNIFPISESKLKEYIPIKFTPEFKYFYVNLRYFLMNVWLSEYGDKYDWLLFCDTRDIIFQENPFYWTKDVGVHLQRENSSHPLGEDRPNVEWVRDFKPDFSIYSKTIINGGIVYGSCYELSIFLNELYKYIINANLLSNDQGALNYFIYFYDFSVPIYLYDFMEGFAISYHFDIWRLPDKFYPIDSIIYNLNTIPILIHGYDKGLRMGTEKRKELYSIYVKNRTQCNV